MAENIPPSGHGGTDATRGVPYYEKLKRDLRETLQRKRLIDKNTATLEEQIYKFEGSYLEETVAGNIIKGFDNYIKGSGTGFSSTATSAGGGTSTRRKGGNLDQERVFSRSSVSYMRDGSPSTSAQTTPSHGPTPPVTGRRDSEMPGSAGANGPHSAMANKNANKRSKKGDDDDTKDKDSKDGKVQKRLKITYARGDRNGD